MARFRKKPVEIEAVQWNQHGDHPAVLCGYIGNDGQCFPIKPPYESIECAVIRTLEGWHVVTEGDWIITGVKGEQYPCKPDIFAATYDEVVTHLERPTIAELEKILAEPDAKVNINPDGSVTRELRSCG